MFRRAALLACVMVGLLPVFSVPLHTALGAISTASPGTAPAGAPLPQILLGNWSAGTVSGITFVNPLTGEYAPPTGAGERYTFAADGQFVFGGLLQTSFYSCTTSYYIYTKGKASATKDGLTLVPDQSAVVSKDTCNAKYNYTKKGSLAVQTFRWAIDRYQRGTKLCLQQRTPKPDAKPNCGYSSRAPRPPKPPRSPPARAPLPGAAAPPAPTSTSSAWPAAARATAGPWAGSSIQA